MNVEELLYGIGIPFTYHHFDEEEVPPCPFICYLYPTSDNFGADGKVYKKINALDIELYTDEKDPETEKWVEDALDENGIFYDKEETYIETEQYYMTIYHMEVLKNE